MCIRDRLPFLLPSFTLRMSSGLNEGPGGAFFCGGGRFTGLLGSGVTLLAGGKKIVKPFIHLMLWKREDKVVSLDTLNKNKENGVCSNIYLESCIHGNACVNDKKCQHL